MANAELEPTIYFMEKPMTNIAWCAGFAIAMSLHGVAFAQAWPTKPVRFLVGNGAGGSDDFHVRTITPKLAEIFGQQFVVDNRPGAGGLIASTVVLNAPKDGHTILLAGQSHPLRRFLDANMPFDPMRAFAHTALFNTFSQILVVNPSVKANSVSELISLARTQPGKLTIGELGGAGMVTISSIFFRAMAKVNLTPVPYKDGYPLRVDLISGRLDAYFGPIQTMSPLIAAGKLRALGVGGGQAFRSVARCADHCRGRGAELGGDGMAAHRCARRHTAGGAGKFKFCGRENRRNVRCAGSLDQKGWNRSHHGQQRGAGQTHGRRRGEIRPRNEGIGH